ncbi:fungal-specific transcription factor domain-containing protein [Phyllosticta paracitricarpa]|uniref:Fungal-specific transcription factor domain-containing protein n=1 Tax=Phyllosticta paracitricarpa TaxID=2016321 RepID=A0ABR1NLB6_9PEZI
MCISTRPRRTISCPSFAKKYSNPHGAYDRVLGICCQSAHWSRCALTLSVPKRPCLQHIYTTIATPGLLACHFPALADTASDAFFIFPSFCASASAADDISLPPPMTRPEVDFNDLSREMPWQRQRSTPPPRKRTERACDQCRKKKSACDGGHPCNKCFPSTRCTYKPLSKKSASPASDSGADNLSQRNQSLEDEKALLRDRLSRQETFVRKALFAFIHRASSDADGDVPSQETPGEEILDKLIAIYFENIHPQLPMIRAARFKNSSESPYVWEKPPPCLRYIMAALAATTDASYVQKSRGYYNSAKKCFQRDKDDEVFNPQSIHTLSHVQASVLIATYEYRSGISTQAYSSTRNALDLCNLMRLYKEPGPGIFEDTIAAAPKDAADAEERRRTFWVCFDHDVYTSIEEGTPRLFKDEDITVRLPMSDEDFEVGREVVTMTLDHALTFRGVPSPAPFAAACVMACLLGRIASHNEKGKLDNDFSDAFLKRYKELDSILEDAMSSLAEEFKSAGKSSNPSHVFVGVSLHSARIMLHRVALERVKHLRDRTLEKICKDQCAHAAHEISKMFDGLEKMNMSWFPAFTSYCLRMAAKVLQFLKQNKDYEDQALVRAMQALEVNTTSYALDRVRKLNLKFRNMTIPGCTNSNQQNLQSFGQGHSAPAPPNAPIYWSPQATSFEPQRLSAFSYGVSNMQPTMMSNQGNQFLSTSPMNSEATMSGSDYGSADSSVGQYPDMSVLGQSAAAYFPHGHDWSSWQSYGAGTGQAFWGNQSG